MSEEFKGVSLKGGLDKEEWTKNSIGGYFLQQVRVTIDDRELRKRIIK